MNEWGELEDDAEEEKLKISALESGNVIKRADYLAQVLFVWIMQMLLCIVLIDEIIFGDGMREGIASYPGYWVVISRFVCCIVLHMALQD